jgi:hypothetical protein
VGDDDVVPAPSNQDRARLIDQLVEAYGSVARFVNQPGQELVNPIPPELHERAQKQLMADALKRIMDRFLDPSWKSLAQDPKAFNSELDELLAGLGEWMKRCYGLGSRRPHRPKKYGERDQQIYEQRRQGLTFGQIGLGLNLPDKVAERACKRYEKSAKKELRDFLTFLFDACDQASAADSRSTPPKSIPPTTSTT